VFDDEERLTSANSISVGRLLPQAVYPFFAYSRISNNNEPIIASIPSGNFGDMMGTIIAKQMGLPISKIICGLNENKGFLKFLNTGQYEVKPRKVSPSSAMNVSHPSNLARLFDFYKGHMFDKRDPKTKRVIQQGVIDILPDLEEMREDICSISVNNQEHYETIKKVFAIYSKILDPHGAVGWKALEFFLNKHHQRLAVIYETADPGKFPEDIKKAIGIIPKLPLRMQEQADLKETIYSIESESEQTKEGLKLSNEQIEEAKSKIKEIFS